MPALRRREGSRGQEGGPRGRGRRYAGGRPGAAGAVCHLGDSVAVPLYDLRQRGLSDTHEGPHGRGCRFCASHGFDLTAPARVYVMQHHRHNAVKVGIGGTAGRNERVAHHRRSGWVLVQDWHFVTGVEAHAVEQAVLQHLREAGHGPYLSRDIMPNGWTETFDTDLVTPAALAAIVETNITDLAGTVKPVPGGTILRPERWSVRSDTATSGRRPVVGKAGRGQLQLF